MSKIIKTQIISCGGLSPYGSEVRYIDLYFFKIFISQRIVSKNYLKGGYYE